jgi:hypothetical protein
MTERPECDWPFSATPINVSSSSPSLLAGYGSDLMENFPADLQNPAWPGFGNGGTPSSAASVITSLELESDYDLFAVAWIQSAQQTGFEGVQNTVTAANLEAAANQEGANSRVLTAVSNNAGGITYLSYGWQADTTTLYEAHVVTTSLANAPTAAADLAAQGFIITATGRADSSGNILLVGKRTTDSIAQCIYGAASTSCAS